MKQNNLLKLLYFVILCSATVVKAQTGIMTYNIRYNNRGDGDNRWDLRKAELTDLIRYYQPGIIGMQEVLVDQLNYLNEHLEGYASVGVGREDGKTKGEFAPILYQKAAFKLLDFHTYWLSETPEKVSVGWDAALERIVTYVSFIDKQSEETLYVFNAHFDHMGEVARQKSAELIWNLIKDKQLEDKKVIVMGDFNLLPESAPIQFLGSHLDDAYTHSITPPYGPDGTFNDFDPYRVLQGRIDHIFTKNLGVSGYRIIDDRRKNNLYPSDHLPVYIKLNANNTNQ